eukprot:5962729-Pleurochrysis_carterae.AAC.2
MYLKPSPRAAVPARMHSLPFWFRIACVLAERSRSAPQNLGSRSAHGRHSLTVPALGATPQARPAPAPAFASRAHSL